MSEQKETDAAIILLKEALQFEKKKLKSREWPEAIVAAVEAKIKSYKDTIDARRKTITHSEEEKAVEN